MIYEDVFRSLTEKKVKYAVAGGVAAVLHGVVRFTADLDIIIEMSPRNIDGLFSVLADLGYKPKLPVTAGQFKDARLRREWIVEKGMKAFSFFHVNNPLRMIDILVGESASYSRFKRESFHAKDLNIPVISVTDLKRLKKKAARPQDMADVRSLTELEKMRRKRR